MKQNRKGDRKDRNQRERKHGNQHVGPVKGGDLKWRGRGEKTRRNRNYKVGNAKQVPEADPALRTFRRTCQDRGNGGGEDSYEHIADARRQGKESWEMSTGIQHQENDSQGTIELHSHEPTAGNDSQRASQQGRHSK